MTREKGLLCYVTDIVAMLAQNRHLVVLMKSVSCRVNPPFLRTSAKSRHFSVPGKR